MASPTRLIDIETLKQGAALLQNEHDGGQEWQAWANQHAGDIMEALTAFSALEHVLDHTWITELCWYGDPGTWWLKTDADQTGEEEGEWQGETLFDVLRDAAADFAAADEADEADDDEGTEVLRG